MLKNIIPLSLKKFEDIEILLQVVQKELDYIDTLVKEVLIISRLDELGESIIDELCLNDYHILPQEGFRFADTIEKKRDLIKNSLYLHATKGTREAVEKVLNIIGIKGKVKEWYECDEEPFIFQIDADSFDGIDFETIAQLERLVMEFKNVRSVLRGFKFELNSRGDAFIGCSIIEGEELSVRPYFESELDLKETCRACGVMKELEYFKICLGGING